MAEPQSWDELVSKSEPAAPSSWDDLVAESKKDPGYVGEAIRGVKAGVKVQLPKMAGQALQFFGAEETGKKLVEDAEARNTPALQESAIGQAHDSPWSVRGNIYEAATNAVPSLAPGAAGAAAGAALGSIIPGAGTAMGALVGYAVGSIAALPMFYGSQAKESYDAVKKTQLEEGKSEAEADSIATKTAHAEGAIEAGGEVLADVIPFAKLFKPVARPVAKAAGTLVMDALVPTFKQGAKTAAGIVGAEVATEMAQQAGEDYVRKEMGDTGPGATWGETSKVIMPTAIMSAIPGMAGAGARHVQRNAAVSALVDPETDPETRSKIAMGVSAAIQETDPTLARNFAAYSARQIHNEEPIEIGKDATYENQQKLLAAPQPIVPEAPADNSADVAAAEENAAKVYGERNAHEARQALLTNIAQAQESAEKTDEVLQAHTLDDAIESARDAISSINVPEQVANDMRLAHNGRMLLERMEKSATEEAAYAERESQAVGRDAELAKLNEDDRTRTQRSILADMVAKGQGDGPIAMALKQALGIEESTNAISEQGTGAGGVQRSAGPANEGQGEAVGGGNAQPVQATGAQEGADRAQAQVSAKIPTTPEEVQAATAEHLEAARNLTRSPETKALIEAEIARRAVNQEQGTNVPESRLTNYEGRRNESNNGEVPSGIRRLDNNETTLPQSEKPEIQNLRGEGNNGVQGMEGKLHNLPEGHRHSTIPGNVDGTQGREQGLRALERSVGEPQATGVQQNHQPVVRVPREKNDDTGLGEGNRTATEDAVFQAEADELADRKGAHNPAQEQSVGGNARGLRVTERLFGRPITEASPMELKAALKHRLERVRVAAQQELDRRTVKVPPELAGTVREMAKQRWFEEGGKAAGGQYIPGITRKTQAELNEAGQGRTQWVGKPLYAGSGMSQTEVQAAVERAIAGQPMGERQRRVVQGLVDEAANLAITPEQEAEADRLAEEAVMALQATEWNNLTKEEQDAEFDKHFGPGTGQAKDSGAASEGARASAGTDAAEARGQSEEINGPSAEHSQATSQGGVHERSSTPSTSSVGEHASDRSVAEEATRATEARPSLTLEAPTEAALAAKQAQAETGNIEERHAVVRDRDTAILSAPEGTAPPRDVSEQKVPTQQPALFPSVQQHKGDDPKEVAAKNLVVDAMNGSLSVDALIDKLRNTGLQPGTLTAITQRLGDKMSAEQQRRLLTPTRTADTMSEAIALSSPNGSMSKRARDAANERLRTKLFGEDGLQKPETRQPSERESLLAHAKRLRELAARGMSPRKHILEAERAEARASLMEEKPAFSRETADEQKPRAYRRAPGRYQALKAEDVRRIIAPIIKNWGNAPKIRVIATLAEAPEAVRRTDEAQREGGATGEPEAFIHAGTVYMVADGLASEASVVRALFHESFGHFGLRGVLGDRIVTVLNEVVKSAPKRVEAKAKEYGLDFSNQDAKLIAAEEVLAEIAQTRPTLGIVRRAVAVVRQFLRELGLELKLSDSDIIANYILPAREFVTNAKQGGWTGGTAFARGDDAMFSRAEHLGTLTADQKAALRNVHGDPATWRTRLDTLKKDWKKNLVQGIFDQYAPILDLSPQAYRLARMSKGGDSTLESLLMYDKVYVDKNGSYRSEYTKARGFNGFAKVLASLHGEQDRFFEWVAALRAERLKSIGLENLYSDKDISTLKTLNQGAMKDGTTRGISYANALKQLNEWNDSVLKIAADSGLIDEATRKMYEGMPYVPFYRLQEEGTTFGMKAGLVNQTAWKKLKGGTAHLNDDLLANVLQNWSHLITASAKNRAAKATLEAAVRAKVAEEVPSGTPGKGLVGFKDNGKERVFRVTDPHLMDAISALDYAGAGPWAKPFSAMKRALTIGVTVNPAFKIRNLIRDSIQAIGTAELSYNPAKNIAQGYKAFEKESEVRAQLLAAGGAIRFGSMLDGNNADRTRRLIEQGVKPEYILDDASKVTRFWKERVVPAFETYQEFGDRGEQISRAALYEQLLAKGMSHEEASFWARDLMDFSLMGKWNAVRTLSQIVPFWNARLQGIYKLGRATKADYKRMGTTLGAVALSSIALLLAYGDDDDWKKREEWDRENFWWFKVGGVAFRIPKPFEIGAIGTLAERSVEYLISNEMTGKRFAERMSATVFNQLSMNPTPQLVKPLMDLYANKDSFTDRPIETMGMEKLRKQDRATERTTELAKFLGSVGMPDPTKLVMGKWDTLSPVQIEALVRGYFGWLGTSTTVALDWGIRPMMDRGQRPDMQLRDVFLAGNFVETLPSNASRYVTRLYDQAQEIEQAYGSYRDALKRGDLERAQSIRESEADKLRQYGMVETIKRRESLLNEQARRIEASKDIPGDEKRRRLDLIAQRKNDLARALR